MKGALLLVLCLSAGAATAQLRVAATTTFVGEIVASVGGSNVAVGTIYPRDADPHAYEPKPSEVARLVGSRVVFMNGLGLENALRGPLDTLKADGASVVEVSAGVRTRHGGDCQGDHDHHDHAVDPHVWYDPVALMTWTTNIVRELSRLDPAHAEDYRVRGRKQAEALIALDAWIRTQVATIPAERRVLVTDHEALGYYADRYGLRIAGAVMPGVSTLAEPSARDLAALQRLIARESVRTIFVGGGVTPQLVERVAADVGAKVVLLPACALGTAGTETGTLDGYLRALTRAIVRGLKKP